MKKPPLKKVRKVMFSRKVMFWVRYRPSDRTIVQMSKYKYHISQPSKSGGDVVFQVKGFYVPTPAEQK